MKVLKKFDTFISGVDFSLGSTVGADGLAARGPVDWAIEPEDEAGDGAGFEEFNRGVGVLGF